MSAKGKSKRTSTNVTTKKKIVTENTSSPKSIQKTKKNNNSNRVAASEVLKTNTKRKIAANNNVAIALKVSHYQSSSKTPTDTITPSMMTQKKGKKTKKNEAGDDSDSQRQKTKRKSSHHSSKNEAEHYQNQNLMLLGKQPIKAIYRYWLRHYANKYPPQSMNLSNINNVFATTNNVIKYNEPMKTVIQVSDGAVDRVQLAVSRLSEEILTGVKEIMIKEGRVTAKVEDIHDSVYTIAKNQPTLLLVQ